MDRSVSKHDNRKKSESLLNLGLNKEFDFQVVLRKIYIWYIFFLVLVNSLYSFLLL